MAKSFSHKFKIDQQVLVHLHNSKIVSKTSFSKSFSPIVKAKIIGRGTMNESGYPSESGYLISILEPKYIIHNWSIGYTDLSQYNVNEKYMYKDADWVLERSIKNDDGVGCWECTQLSLKLINKYAS